MDQLCEPVEVNQRFIKMLEQDIIPKYEDYLNDIFEKVSYRLDRVNEINKQDESPKILKSESPK